MQPVAPACRASLPRRSPPRPHRREKPHPSRRPWRPRPDRPTLQRAWAAGHARRRDPPGPRPRVRGFAAHNYGQDVASADPAPVPYGVRTVAPECAAAPTPGGWLTTVVGRVCLDMSRSRTSRREDLLDPLDPLNPPDAQVPPDRPDRQQPVRRRPRAGCWPTWSASRSLWSWKRWPPRNGSPSYCTTCSLCPTTRSPPSSDAPRQRPTGWSAAPLPGAGQGPGPRHRSHRPAP